MSSKPDDLRLEGLVRRGETITVTLDGQPVTAYEGESVAAALWAAGIRTLRTTAKRGSPRGVFCGIGVCQDCLVTIDGRPSQRACRTVVRDGMAIATQPGYGEWS
ncbi:MAG: (2Fe-2S)-binding protein [Chloroflexi bacterium]|nr:(2Fe-2S)-binding protein [Chloroflexota bacterium]